jgi:hypothetical protein
MQEVAESAKGTKPISIDLGDCIETYPCKHSVEIEWDDGRKRKKFMNGPTVARFLKKYNLSTVDQEHLDQYLDEWFEIFVDWKDV